LLAVTLEQLVVLAKQGATGADGASSGGEQTGG